MKIDIGKNIRLLRGNAGLTQQQLADKIGMSQSIVGKLEMETRSLKIDVLEKIAEALDVSLSELIFKAHPFPYRHVPIRGVVNAGEPMITFDDLTDYETVAFDTERGDFFALKVQGHSMDKVAPDGSTIIIDPKQTDPQALHKQAIVAIQDGEVLFKMWDNSLKLFQPKSTRDDYDPIPAKYGAQILGKVVAFIVRC
jgi:transcriptional regulator with XRE-family HTH domain